MERINTSNACHFFIACRSDRSLATYVIDLTSARGLDAVPHFRYRCGIENNAVYKFDWQLSLNPDQFTLVSLVDGHRTLREIVAEAARNTATAHFARSSLRQPGTRPPLATTLRPSKPMPVRSFRRWSIET
jgi:hypothetical protein